MQVTATYSIKDTDLETGDELLRTLASKAQKNARRTGSGFTMPRRRARYLDREVTFSFKTDKAAAKFKRLAESRGFDAEVELYEEVE